MRIAIRLIPAAILLAAVAPCARAEALTADELARVKADEAARCQAVQQVFGSVVAVYRQALGQGGGSGVVIHPDGWALTNYHVVRAAGKSGKAGLADGNLYGWEVYGMDPGGDLAVIRLKGRDAFPAAPLGDSDAVRAGDWALAMGNPFVLAEDQKPTVTLGIVSGVSRFQHGLGGRALVYGNCIQVDSSINPGNSGGPLFDGDGRLIGINGRGSFEERGRVNVGVGYAISIEQARNFLPDLIASKLCQHGTLDATFVDAGGGVICDAVNIESPIGQRGLRPGDALLAFDGRAVRTANEFLNRITTFPAHWPVEVTFRHDGRPVSAWVRLTPLPYGQALRPRNPVRPRVVPGRPPEQPDEDAEDAPQPDADGGEEARPPEKKQENPPDADGPDKKEDEADDAEPEDGQDTDDAAPEQPEAEPGSIMDTGHNRKACAWLLRQYVAFLGGREAVAPALAALAQPNPLDAFEEVELEGGDRAARRRAFRLRVKQPDGPACVVWFSAFDDRGALEVRLVKTALASEAETDGQAWTFGDYRPVGGLMVPHRIRQVRGLDERVEAEHTVADGRMPGNLPAGTFIPSPPKTEAP